MAAGHGRRGGEAPITWVTFRKPLASISLSSTMRRECSMFHCRHAGLIAFNVANRRLSTFSPVCLSHTMNRYTASFGMPSLLDEEFQYAPCDAVMYSMCTNAPSGRR